MKSIFAKENRAGLIAFLLLLGAVAFVLYWRTSVEESSGDYHVKKGNYRLEDGQYAQAIAEFERAIEQNPQHALAYLELALAKMHLNRYDDALGSFNQAIALDTALAVAYADRGILHDKMGHHRRAMEDYHQALALDPKLAKGPGWLWRFLHNVHEKPATIAARMAYLAAELEKPPEQRLLQVPALDQQQRMNKY